MSSNEPAAGEPDLAHDVKELQEVGKELDDKIFQSECALGICPGCRRQGKWLSETWLFVRIRYCCSAPIEPCVFKTAWGWRWENLAELIRKSRCEH